MAFAESLRRSSAGFDPETSGDAPPGQIITPIGINAEHGVIVTVLPKRAEPSRTQQLLLNVAANQATMALLTHYAREEQRITDTLQRIGAAVAAQMDPEKVIQTVTDEATSLSGANFGAFFYNVVNDAG